jgi:hypothetical protein
MQGKMIGAMALVLLAVLVIGGVVGLPLWGWGIVLACCLILVLTERAWRRSHMGK